MIPRLPTKTRLSAEQASGLKRRASIAAVLIVCSVLALLRAHEYQLTQRERLVTALREQSTLKSLVTEYTIWQSKMASSRVEFPSATQPLIADVTDLANQYSVSIAEIASRDASKLSLTLQDTEFTQVIPVLKALDEAPNIEIGDVSVSQSSQPGRIDLSIDLTRP